VSGPQVGDVASSASAVSSIVRAGRWLHLVADDQPHVLSMQIDRSAGAATIATRFRDSGPALDAVERKATKPDVEALLLLDAGSSPRLVALGSGSTERRRAGYAWQLADDGSLAEQFIALDLGPLYDTIAARTGATVNVEGACQLGDEVLLLLRSSSTGANRLATLRAWRLAQSIDTGNVAPDLLERLVDCELGTLGGVRLGFTDATVVDGALWFTAAAEDTANAYDDGMVAGSVLGVLDRDGHVIGTWRLDADGAKVEGICAHAHGPATRALLVTDSDDPAVASRLLECDLPVLPRRRVVVYVTRGTHDEPELLVFDQPHDSSAGTQVPAGGIDPHELAEAGAARETMEETAVEVHDVRMLGRMAQLASDGTPCDNWYFHARCEHPLDAWTHVATAGEADAGLEFACRFIALADAGTIVHPAHRAFLHEIRIARSALP